MSNLLGNPFIFFFLTLVIAEDISMRPTEKIIVGFSKREPFIYTNQLGTPKGLDISIMENFAQKFKLQLEFVEQKMSLNEVSDNNEKAFEEYIQQIDLQ